ncbi:MAG TPA: SRPBCC domain-containing protein [Verrucomicrobiae bacterium]|nr:SRPBCC domain-containing protein [Verrucomicrobiae bacterium]
MLVRVTQHFPASADEVFAAWLDPRMLGEWMFGPNVREEEIVHLNVDARIGGAFSFLVRRQGREIDHVGQYLEINSPRRLVFTWGIAGSDSSRVEIEIMPTSGGCELALTHELAPAWADYADRTRAGWTNMLGVLAKVLG